MGKIVDGIYYNSESKPEHKGIVKSDGKFYYAGKDGKIIKDQAKVVHSVMTNDLVKHGTYYFDQTGAMDLSTYKSPKRKKKKMSKTVKYISIAASGFAVLVALLVIIGVTLKNTSNKSITHKTVGAGITVSVPDYKEEVYLCSAQVQSYYEGAYSLKEIINTTHTPYSPFVFEYEIDNAEKAVLLLSENKDFTDGAEYKLNVQENKLSIDNLKTGTQYYFKVTATDKSGKNKTVASSFKTADTNRYVYLPGLYNTRDIGGYETIDHKRVKQGLLIRGTEADGLVENRYYLVDPKDAEPFGFVCEFDLRSSDIANANYVSRFGSDVTHRFYNSPQYGGVFEKRQEKYLRQIFSDLADRRNYPMYLHCTYGADRTGTIVFLLQGLLGVSEEDMLTEYKLTGFLSSDYGDAEKIRPLYSGLEGMPGKNINEKIYNYMVGTVGVTEQQIEELRAIFLE